MIWGEDARRGWPRAPKGFVFLAEAVDLVGRHLFGSQWTILDPAARVRFPKHEPSFEMDDASDLSEAMQRLIHKGLFVEISVHNDLVQRHNEVQGPMFDRANEVKRRFTSAATDGNLTISYISSAAGDMKRVPPVFWASVTAWEVFTVCQLEPQPWMAEGDRRFPVDLFVSEPEFRSLDWAQVTWRVAAQPLGDDHLYRAAVPKMPNLVSDVAAWIRAPSDRSGAPGRPSPMHLIEQDMRERAMAKQMLPSLAAEAAELAKRYHANPAYDALARITAKTITNRLREIYRELKAR